MKSVFQKSNPTKTLGCDEDDCLPCMEGKGMCGDCRKTGIGYRMECCECETNVHYEGETSKSGYVRGLKHLSNYKAKTLDSPLWKHAAVSHNGRMDVKYKMRVLKSFRDPLTRQVNEAVRIQQSNADILLNSKSEWFGPATHNFANFKDCFLKIGLDKEKIIIERLGPGTNPSPKAKPWAN